MNQTTEKPKMSVAYLTTIFNTMVAESKDYGTAGDMSAADWLTEFGAYMMSNMEVDENEAEIEELQLVQPDLV